MIQLIMSWFWGVLSTSTAQVRWLSHFQLHGDFTAATGHPGPIKSPGWTDGALIPGLALRGYSFKQLTRWFIKILKECVKHMGQHVHYAYGLPYSQMIQMHTGLFAVPWPESHIRAVDSWTFSYNSRFWNLFHLPADRQSLMRRFLLA